MKKALWHYLSQVNKVNVMDEADETDIAPWLDALNLTQDGSTLKVTFPHAYFSAWFAKNKRRAFEEAVSACYPQLFSSIVYEGIAQTSGQDTSAGRPVTLSTKKEPESSTKTPIEQNNGCLGSDVLYNDKNAFLISALANVLRNEPDQAASSIFLYGQSGTGKTHLLQTLATEFAAQGRNIYLADPETYGEPATFLKPSLFWRDYSAFFLDDIQDLAQSPGKQNILLHLLDTAQSTKCGQIFLTASKSIDQLNLDPRLTSRLSAGLILKVHPPDLDVRIRFLQKQCRETMLRITRKQTVLLARQCTQFRQLQGVIEKMKVLAGTQKRALSQADIDLVLQPDTADYSSDHKEIIDAVSQKMRVSTADIMSKKRKSGCVLARQVCMYLCRNELGLSYSELGRIFGKKDHSTVHYAIQKIESLAKQDSDMRKLLDELGKK